MTRDQCPYCEGSGRNMSRNTGFRIPACTHCHGTGKVKNMNKFDRWYSENTDGLLGDEHQAYNHAKKAWNAALDEVSKALEIHDTLGDIKYEVNKRLRTDD